jgi:multiple sugar transport system substrate-binding protein
MSDQRRLILPPSVEAAMSRRRFMQSAAVAAGGVSFASVLAACSKDSAKDTAAGTDAAASAETTGTSAKTSAAMTAETTAAAATAETTAAAAAAAGGKVTFGSNYSDDVPKTALAAAIAASGLDVSTNTIEHNAYQENINTYLQGSPDDVWCWFAGYRMKFFADKGLAGDVSDVWAGLPAGELADSFKGASTGNDGKQYFVPYYLYPWALFYRKSVFAEKGYEIPKTMDALKKLGDQMKKDGLAPIAFGDKDGWPAMGTFDYINMRLNGYDYHVSLMAGKEDWAGDKVKGVFNTWAELLPYHQEGSLGRTWQEAAGSLRKKEAGMYLLGMFVGEQFQDEGGKVGPDYEDLDYFAFPEIAPENGQDSVEAPIDGFAMAAKPKNPEGAKALLKFMASPAGIAPFVAKSPNNVAANSKADVSGYGPLQQKAVELISSAKHISQFMDRDTRPDFASNVMIPSIQEFIKNPKDIDSLVKKIAEQQKAIFAS